MGMGNITDVLFKHDLSYDGTICVINKSFKIEGRSVKCVGLKDWAQGAMKLSR